ncbi:MAG: acyltransferase [Chryseolinea sp.]
MAESRSYYIDNVRVALTALVILHHAAVTYGAPGSWYYKETPDGIVSGLILTVFVSINQSFFMGLFFFLSAYFIPTSFKKKGTTTFLGDRLKRLGIPLIFYSLVLAPLTNYIVLKRFYKSDVSFIDFYVNREQWIDFGVLWFTAALLVFTSIYLIAAKKNQNVQPSAPPGNQRIFVFATLLGLISFVVRIVYPIGWTLQPLGFQIAHFTQYIALFTAGIMCYRRNWLSGLTPERLIWWRRMSLVLVLIGFPCIYMLKIFTGAGIELFLGGFTIHSFVNAMWEQWLGVSLCIVVLGMAKLKWNSQNERRKKLSRSAYAAYIIHPLILTAVSMLLIDLTLPSLAIFLLAGGLAVVLTFVIALGLVRVPLIRDVV